jgi:hypothetical protein
LDSIDDPSRTSMSVANIRHVTSSPVLMSSQAMATDLHPATDPTIIQQVTPDTRCVGKTIGTAVGKGHNYH